MRRAALAVTVLLAACALPARAALVCQQFTATLAQGTGGGCISTTVSQVTSGSLGLCGLWSVTITSASQCRRSDLWLWLPPGHSPAGWTAVAAGLLTRHRFRPHVHSVDDTCINDTRIDACNPHPPHSRCQDALWTATNGTTNATATFFGPQPTSTPVGGKLNYVFLAGASPAFLPAGRPRNPFNPTRTR
jgi:hypothetical protein